MQFETVIPGVGELDDGPPEEVALENAFRKAAAVAERATGPVLGVDTVVCIDGRIYDKPQDREEARATLRALSGKAHTVIGGICLIEAARPQTAVARTTVEFRRLDDALIDWYLASGEWRDRAGAYAIQGRGGALVRRIEGDYLNVVGLSVSALLELAPWLLGAQSA